MSTLVTGADGFIGSHLVEYLVEKGETVRALVQYNSLNSWGWLDNSKIADRIEIVSGDVRDPFFCDEITRDIDTVYHLAALIAIPYSYAAPQSYVATNVEGTVNMCKAAVRNKIKRFIQTSTSETYGSAKYVPIDEDHPMQPQSPYSASKIAADALAMSFFYSFDLPVTIARPFNTYGPRQSARAVIPTIITQIADGAESIKLGDVSPTRDFNFVEDTCRGLFLLANSEKAIGETLNIGSNYEISISDTLNLIKSLMKSDVQFVTDSERFRPKKSEVQRLWCDNSKIKKMTGFTPEYTLENGLEITIDWFSKSKNLEKYKSKVYNV